MGKQKRPERRGLRALGAGRWASLTTFPPGLIISHRKESDKMNEGTELEREFSELFDSMSVVKQLVTLAWMAELAYDHQTPGERDSTLHLLREHIDEIEKWVEIGREAISNLVTKRAGAPGQDVATHEGAQ